MRLLNIFFFSWIISPHKEFTKRWRDVIDNKIQAVLSEKALTLITALEQHVQAGCLSAIPPEVGDENFSEIHNTLRKSVSHCRITVPLVSALFSMCLHEVSRYPFMFVVYTGLEFSRNFFLVREEVRKLFLLTLNLNFFIQIAWKFPKSFGDFL